MFTPYSSSALHPTVLQGAWGNGTRGVSLCSSPVLLRCFLVGFLLVWTHPSERNGQCE